MNKVIVHCEDPVFVGIFIYTDVKGETVRTKPIIEAREYADGSVQFDTQHKTYVAQFTTEKYRREFLGTCNVIGKLWRLL